MTIVPFPRTPLSRRNIDDPLAAAREEGARCERIRIAGILALDLARTHRAAALTIAFRLDMGVDEAKNFLAGLPEESP